MIYPLVIFLLIQLTAITWFRGDAESRINSPSKKIIPSQDLVYIGAFRVPQGTLGLSYWGYAGGFITFNPAGNGGAGSLIAPDRENGAGAVGEISIPAPVNGPITSMNTATSLQNFTSITGGITNHPVFGVTVLPQQGNQTSSKLYWTAVDNYQPANSLLTLGWSDLTFSNPNAKGVWSLANAVTAQYSYYLLGIPAASWDETKRDGWYLGLGRDRINNSTEGYGPSLFVAAPWTQGNGPTSGTALDNVQLIGYPPTHLYDKNYAHGDGIMGAAWITMGKKASLVFAQNKGMRTRIAWSQDVTSQPPQGDYPFESYKCPNCNWDAETKEDTNYSPPTTDYKAYPYAANLLFYDTNDLVAVAEGTKRHYDVLPYARYNIERYLKRTQGAVGKEGNWRPLGGVAYDPGGHKLYAAEMAVDTGAYPIIHVFQIQDNGGTLDAVSPSIPSEITNVGPVVTWTASKDMHGSSATISYLIFKWFPAVAAIDADHSSYPAMWRPIAWTTATTWTDPAYTEGDKYNVTAYDAYMNPSNILK